MSSLDFLYIALGIGFVLLVIFFCVLILYMILILRDVNKMTTDAAIVSNKVKKTIVEPLELLNQVLRNWKFLENIINKCKRNKCEETKKEYKNKKGFRVNKIHEE